MEDGKGAEISSWESNSFTTMNELTVIRWSILIPPSIASLRFASWPAGIINRP